jgi:hypothetical protein
MGASVSLIGDDDDDAIDFAGDGAGVDLFDAMPSLAPPREDDDDDAPWVEAKEKTKQGGEGEGHGR